MKPKYLLDSDVFSLMVKGLDEGINHRMQKLAQGEATVNELAEPFAMSLPAISRHLKVLERAKLISRGRSAQWRPCRLEPEPLKAVDGWLGDYRKLWEQRFDRLEEYLTAIQKEREDVKEDKT